MPGWIKLHRSLLDWGWWDDINTSRLFIYCLLRANHKPNVWHGISVDRGEFISSLDGLSKDTGLSKQKIRTCLKRLKSTQELTQRSESQYTVFKVENYEQYQEPTQELTREQHGSNTAATPDKNEENVKNSTNIDETAVSRPSCPHQEIVDSYHENLPMLPKVKIWSNPRQSLLRSRWSENEKHQNIEFWNKLFRYVATSDFLIGNAGDFKATLEWIIKSSNFIKIIEGNYHD